MNPWQSIMLETEKTLDVDSYNHLQRTNRECSSSLLSIWCTGQL